MERTKIEITFIKIVLVIVKVVFKLKELKKILINICIRIFTVFNVIFFFTVSFDI